MAADEDPATVSVETQAPIGRNGSTPRSGRDEAAPVDVDRARMQWLENYFQHLVGQKEPLALAEGRRLDADRIVDFLYLCERLEARFGRSLGSERNWAYGRLKVQMRARKDANKIADNLSQPTEDRSLKKKIAGLFGA